MARIFVNLLFKWLCHIWKCQQFVWHVSGLGRKVGYLWQNILNFKRLAVGDRREGLLVNFGILKETVEKIITKWIQTKKYWWFSHSVVKRLQSSLNYLKAIMIQAISHNFPKHKCLKISTHLHFSLFGITCALTYSPLWYRLKLDINVIGTYRQYS